MDMVFTDKCVGQKVNCDAYGNGVIVKEDTSNDASIIVKFEDFSKHKHFYNDGSYFTGTLPVLRFGHLEPNKEFDYGTPEHRKKEPSITSLDWESFEKAFAEVIPKGEFTQFTLEKGATYAQHDSTHDMSIVSKTEDGGFEVSKVGTFTNSEYAGYIETIVNAYRDGDLVPLSKILED